MLNDYFWFRFFRLRKHAIRRGTPLIVVLLVIAGLIYAAVFVIAAMQGAHRIHAH
jgi:hypothetical protein